MKTVTASEFQKNFGAFEELAQREPITVTSNGRDSVVLVSVAMYAALLKANPKAKFAYGGELTEAFDRDVADIMDKHNDVHDALSK